MPYLHFFPEEFIALQRELRNHPEILVQIENCADNAEAYGVIAAALGIVLDGIYEPKDLAAMLTKKLRERSTIIVRSQDLVDKLVPVTMTEKGDTVTFDLVQQGKSKESR